MHTPRSKPDPGLPMSVFGADGALAEILRSFRAVALARIAHDGRLLDANQGFRRLMQGAANDGGEADVRPLFIQPSFAALTRNGASRASATYAGVLTLGSRLGNTWTLSGQFGVSGEGWLLVAEHDVEEIQRSSDLVLRLNDDLGESQRELARANWLLKASEAHVRELSLTDPLTNVGNRRKLDAAIAAEIHRAERYGGRVSVILCDIDHFKQVNDEFGHEAGDRVLVAFGRLIGQSVRPSDTPARTGGEEFAVLLPAAGEDEAAACAERIRSSLAQLLVEPLSRAVTASFGVAEHRAGEQAAGLLARADTALYAAKREGRNRVKRSVVAQAEAGPLAGQSLKM
jgi:two-component system cell cycle response regulator